MSPEHLDAFLFDFDGTIADSMNHVLAIYNSQVADRYGTPKVSPSDIPSLRMMGPREAIRAFNVPLWKVASVLTAVRSAIHNQIQLLEPFPGMAEVLLLLQKNNSRCFVLTSNSHENVETFLVQHRMHVFEQLACGSSMFGKGRRLRALIARARLSTSSAAYVGDEVRDIEAARNAGLRSIAVSWGYADRQALAAAKPDYLFDDPAQLLEFCRTVVESA